jgi:hypothetical protein
MPFAAPVTSATLSRTRIYRASAPRLDVGGRICTRSARASESIVAPFRLAAPFTVYFVPIAARTVLGAGSP